MRALALATVLAVWALWVGRAEAEAPPPCECPGASGAPQTVDLNTADERALIALPGIGPSRARAIVAYRREHGAFRSLSQLLHIKGIGRSLLRELRPLVTMSEGAP